MRQEQTSVARPVYFDCAMCGECCSSWNIPIEKDKAEQLLQKPWVQRRLEETKRKLTPVSGEMYRIPLTSENVCVFLGRNKACLIQEKEGMTLKPEECQRFPFATVKMTDGSYEHDTSAACKHISEVLLLAFQPILPKPFGSDEESRIDTDDFEGGEPAQKDSLSVLLLEDLDCFPDRILLDTLSTLSLKEYQVLQKVFRATLSEGGLSPYQALKCFYHLLKRVKKEDSISFSECLNTCERDTGDQASQLSGWKQFLLQLILLRKPYRTLSWVQLALKKTYSDFKIFDFPVSLKEQASVSWGREGNLLLNAFLFQLLSRKRLLSRRSSLSALLLFALSAIVLVDWYARTLAWASDREETTTSDVAYAIRLTERYYTGHQPRFLQCFNNRWMSFCLPWLLG